MTGSWVSGFAMVLILLFGHIPVAVVLGRRRARALLIASAEQDDRTESARLHTLAHALLIDGSKVNAAHDKDAVSQSHGAAKTMLMSLTKPDKTAFIGRT